jgi:hypothetical protein
MFRFQKKDGPQNGFAWSPETDPFRRTSPQWCGCTIC